MEEHKDEFVVPKMVPDHKDKPSSEEEARKTDLTLEEQPLNIRTVIDSIYKSRELRN